MEARELVRGQRHRSALLSRKHAKIPKRDVSPGRHRLVDVLLPGRHDDPVAVVVLLEDGAVPVAAAAELPAEARPDPEPA